MSQLELFEGEHLAIAKCREALRRGDLRCARGAFRRAVPESPEGEDVKRLTEIEKLLVLGSGWIAAQPDTVHAAFEAMLGQQGGIGPGRLESSDWFRLYGFGMSRALSRSPEQRFRGWCALHFALAAELPVEALRHGERLVSVCREGWAWLEAARAAVAAQDEDRARRWMLVACLTAQGPLDPEPPPILPARTAALNPATEFLPRFPRELADLWSTVEELEVPPPASAWLPVVGILDGALGPSLLVAPDVLEHTGFNPYGEPPTREAAPRAFVRALLAARRAREADPATRAGTCGDRELAQRVEMRALAPVLFDRYLARLGML